MNKILEKFVIFIVAFIMFIGISTNVFAETLKSASNIFCVDENIKEEFDVEENITDVYAVCNYVDLSGDVKGDIIVAGRTANINLENIGGNLRAAAAVVNINSQIDRNITAIAGIIDFKEGASAKDVYICGGEVNFDGKAEELIISGESVKINGEINGDVRVECESLILGENAKIDGIIKVESENEPTILGDINKGRIEFSKLEREDMYDYHFSWIKHLLTVVDQVAAIILAMLIILIFNKAIVKGTDRLLNEPWVVFAIGFAALIVIPITSLLLCFIVVSIPISMIALIIYGIICYLSPIISGVILGKVAFKKMNVYLSAIIGTVLIKIVMIIPYIGGILFFACISLSLGLCVEGVFKLISNNSKN